MRKSIREEDVRSSAQQEDRKDVETVDATVVSEVKSEKKRLRDVFVSPGTRKAALVITVVLPGYADPELRPLSVVCIPDCIGIAFLSGI